MINEQQYRFRFKQFGLNDSKCAMKIGTDGVLLGAWADVSNAHNVLDIGSGSGLISLMIAQRCNSFVTGIEIDKDAYLQSIENIAVSPWSNRIEFINNDFIKWASSTNLTDSYDHIVSNPPFFNNGPEAPLSSRANARHGRVLDYEQLIQLSHKLLTEDGKISLISPIERENDIIFNAEIARLHIIRSTIVYSKAKTKPIRILWELSKQFKSLEQSHISIRNSDNKYSDEYINLTKDFYLNF